MKVTAGCARFALMGAALAALYADEAYGLWTPCSLQSVDCRLGHPKGRRL